MLEADKKKIVFLLIQFASDRRLEIVFCHFNTPKWANFISKFSWGKQKKKSIFFSNKFPISLREDRICMVVVALKANSLLV